MEHVDDEAVVPLQAARSVLALHAQQALQAQRARQALHTLRAEHSAIVALLQGELAASEAASAASAGAAPAGAAAAARVAVQEPDEPEEMVTEETKEAEGREGSVKAWDDELGAVSREQAGIETEPRYGVSRSRHRSRRISWDEIEPAWLQHAAVAL